MDLVKIRMFGKFSIIVEGQDVTSILANSSKSLDILQHLIIHNNRFVEMQELADIFWSESDSSKSLGALKTLISRLRKKLKALSPVFDNCIVSRGNKYKFVIKSSCIIDVFEFNKICKSIINEKEFNKIIREKYIKAIVTYKGRVISKTMNCNWENNVNSIYFTTFVTVLNQFFLHLKRLKEYENLLYFANAVDEINPYILTVNSVIIEALFKLNKISNATKYYGSLIDLYMENGLNFPDEISKSYNKAVEEDVEGSIKIGTICEELSSVALAPTATLCVYSMFKTIYQLQTKALERFEVSINLLLISVNIKDENISDPIFLSSVMNKLEIVLLKSLRKGDTVTRYNFAQLLVLLPGDVSFDSGSINQRVLHAFIELHPIDFEKVIINFEFSRIKNKSSTHSIDNELRI